jgi:glycosyltransferase involved in cell wall biosynthesis
MPSAFSSKIFLLPNAIDFNRFYTSKNQFANKTTNKIFFKLISIGKINENKNQIFLIDVMKLMKDKGYDVRLTLVGDNAHSSELQLKTLKNGLEKDIELVGITDNVEDLLEKSDLYVHAAKNEAFGLVLIEAMAAGLPVVSLDGKGNRDIIEQGKNGFMVYEQNAELFAEKIIELINNKELYHSMSDYAVAFARKYDIKEYVNKLTDVYKKLTAFP